MIWRDLMPQLHILQICCQQNLLTVMSSSACDHYAYSFCITLRKMKSNLSRSETLISFYELTKHISFSLFLYTQKRRSHKFPPLSLKQLNLAWEDSVWVLLLRSSPLHVLLLVDMPMEISTQSTCGLLLVLAGGFREQGISESNSNSMSAPPPKF